MARRKRLGASMVFGGYDPKLPLDNFWECMQPVIADIHSDNFNGPVGQLSLKETSV